MDASRRAGRSHDAEYMKAALRLARRGLGRTSPNPMVGALLVKGRKVIGQGWHRRAGEPHAEIEAFRDASSRGMAVRGSTLYVTLEPCCTHGRTPPCTDAILSAGVRKVVVGATDPNPRHCGKGLVLLKDAGIELVSGVLSEECTFLNRAFNHWIVERTPFVTVKAAMTLDGKIATASGESKWITGEQARAWGMKLRRQSDAILVGINTILADDPSLTLRPQEEVEVHPSRKLRRIVLDAYARMPVESKVVADAHGGTTVFVSERAPRRRVDMLSKRVRVVTAPSRERAKTSRRKDACSNLDLGWILEFLGGENVTSMLVEGGGEVNASFLFEGHAHEVAFFYAPKILGGRASRRSVAGEGAARLQEALSLDRIHWRRLGTDWLLTARVRARG